MYSSYTRTQTDTQYCQYSPMELKLPLREWPVYMAGDACPTPGKPGVVLPPAAPALLICERSVYEPDIIDGLI